MKAAKRHVDGMIARAQHGTPPDGALVILGAGYTGRFLYSHGRTAGFQVFATSRRPEVHLAHVPERARLAFDLARPETWEALPRHASFIWCFPATPLDLVKTCAMDTLSTARRLVVLGSTSAYDLPSPADASTAPELDEDAPLTTASPRVQGEEYLRARHGAIVLRIAGIYGPGRNVLNWIRRGRVTGSSRYVNLIHVEDVAGICLAALEHGTPGEAYNVSDGTPRTWTEICAEAERRWGIQAQPAGPDRRPGKRIIIEKLKTHLGYTFKHPDLYQALNDIEAAEKGSFEF